MNSKEKFIALKTRQRDRTTKSVFQQDDNYNTHLYNPIIPVPDKKPGLIDHKFGRIKP